MESVIFLLGLVLVSKHGGKGQEFILRLAKPTTVRVITVLYNCLIHAVFNGGFLWEVKSHPENLMCKVDGKTWKRSVEWSFSYLGFGLDFVQTLQTLGLVSVLIDSGLGPGLGGLDYNTC